MLLVIIVALLPLWFYSRWRGDHVGPCLLDMPKTPDLDFVVEFLNNKNRKQKAASLNPARAVPVTPEEEELEERGRSSSMFPPGTKVNFLEVLGPVQRTSRTGRMVSQRMHNCICIAPTAEGGGPCGTPLEVSYQQLYQASVYSCGCVARPKHPPIRLEGQKFGRVKVLRWAETEAWELACEVCGQVLYRRSAQEVREAGDSCEQHGIASAVEAEALRAPPKRGRPPTVRAAAATVLPQTRTAGAR